MNRSLKMMLTGIFLAVASVWCLIAGSGNTVFSVIGFYVLPLCAFLCFVTGFTADSPQEPKEKPSVPTDEENKE